MPPPLPAGGRELLDTAAATSNDRPVSKRVGLDLVSVDEVARSMSGRHRARYLERVYTELEIDDCRTSAGIDPRRLAARFAAKEAALKVLSTGEDGVTLREIEVRTEPSGEVGLTLHGRAAARAEAMGVVEIAVSLTCDHSFAAAVVMVDAPETADETGRNKA